MADDAHREAPGTQNADAGSGELVGELVSLFQRKRDELCAEWSRELANTDDALTAGGWQQLDDACGPFYDRYVRFIESQSSEDFDAFMNIALSGHAHLAAPKDHRHEEAAISVRYGQRQLHDVLSRAIIRDGAETDFAHALDLLTTYQKRAQPVATESIRSAMLERDTVIRSQREAILELSTPVLQVRDRLLVCPLIGVFDSDRVIRFIEHLLERIHETRAAGIVIDVTGVPAMDEAAASGLVQAIHASRLVGAFVIVSGIPVEVARTLSRSGIDLKGIETKSGLQEAIDTADRRLEYQRAARYREWNDA